MRGGRRPRHRLLRRRRQLLLGRQAWHRDVFDIQDGDEAKSIVRHIKIAFYLDPLTATTGALRVIPGSHHLGDKFAQELRAYARQGSTDLGVAPEDVPSVALPVTPGDIMIFDHRIMHASFGGSGARRMFAMNLFEPCHTSRQKELTARLPNVREPRDVVFLQREVLPRMRHRAGCTASNRPSSSTRREPRVAEFSQGNSERLHPLDRGLHCKPSEVGGVSQSLVGPRLASTVDPG